MKRTSRIFTVVLSILLGGGLLLCSGSSHVWLSPAQAQQATQDGQALLNKIKEDFSYDPWIQTLTLSPNFTQQPPHSSTLIATVTLTDPTGDGCDLSPNVPVPDITSLTASKIDSTLEFAMTYDQPAELLNRIIGLDVDQNPATGTELLSPLITNVCSVSVDMGVDFMILFGFDVDTGTLVGVLVRTADRMVISTLPVVEEPGKVTVQASLSLMGDDDGNIDFAGALIVVDGILDVINLDVIPNTGHGTLTIAPPVPTIQDCKDEVQQGAQAQPPLITPEAEGALMAILTAAQESFDGGNIKTTLNQMNAFENRVQAGAGIQAVAVPGLIECATLFINFYACSVILFGDPIMCISDKEDYRLRAFERAGTELKTGTFTLQLKKGNDLVEFSTQASKSTVTSKVTAGSIDIQGEFEGAKEQKCEDTFSIGIKEPVKIKICFYIVQNPKGGTQKANTIGTQAFQKKVMESINAIWDQACVSFELIKIEKIDFPDEVFENGSVIENERGNQPEAFKKFEKRLKELKSDDCINIYFVGLIFGRVDHQLNLIGGMTFSNIPAVVISDPVVGADLSDIGLAHELGHVLNVRVDITRTDQITGNINASPKIDDMLMRASGSLFGDRPANNYITNTEARDARLKAEAIANQQKARK